MIRTAILGILLLAVPLQGAGQEARFSPFAAHNGGLRGAPTMVGLNVAWLAGPVGFRLGGAVDAPYSPVAGTLGYDRAPTVTAWSGDLDALLSLSRVGVRLRGWEPSGFVGIGAHGLRRGDGSTATIPVWSYGVQLARPLASWLSLDAEARRRTPFEDQLGRLPPGVDGGWELRAGFSLRIRRSGADRPSRPERVRGR